MDLNDFLMSYLHEIGKAFSELMHPDEFVNCLMNATKYMLKNDGSKFNSEVFKDNFKTLINGRDISKYLERFDNFYDNEFLKLQKCVQPNPNVRRTVKALKDKGYALVIATNPLFPIRAVAHRIEWAELDIDDFIYITSFENSRFCKPDHRYYLEILEKIEKKPQQCIMIGNDVQEDLVAGEAGIFTFLVTEHMINRSDIDYKCDFSGGYEHLENFVNSLPVIL